MREIVMLDSPDAVMATLILLPLLAAVLCYLISAAWAQNTLVGATTLIHVVLAYHLAQMVLQSGAVVSVLGGHSLPLAIALRADGLSALMVALTSVISFATGHYACGWARQQRSSYGSGLRVLLLVLLAGMSALFLADDLFNIYVTLEIATLAAVSLVILAPGRKATEAAMRYLLLAIVGSLMYLLGVALVYAETGVLSMHLLSGNLPPTVVLQVSLLLMTAGLGIKSALFPVHAWLPAAHAAAPSPASALLSALVAKGAIYLILRIWSGPFWGVWTAGAAQLFAALGIVGMLYASVQALRQSSIKRIIAYSTVAQMGYLPLLMALPRSEAWLGASYHAMSHGLAKAAMFLAAGNLVVVYGNDRLSCIGGAGRRMGTNTLALAMASMSLIGLPPSGGFLAKWWLIQAALQSGQWWWALAMLAGSLLAAAYLLRLLGFAMRELDADKLLVPSAELPLGQSLLWPPLALASGAVLVGFLGVPLARLIATGAPQGWAP
jgi:multicomponent Na+:H+ antiporter subunit D